MRSSQTHTESPAITLDDTRTSSSSIYNLISYAASSERVTAAVDKAVQYLPASTAALIRTASRRTSANTTTPPPILITLTTKTGENIYTPVHLSSTLFDLSDLCQREAGISQPFQRLIIQEDQPSAVNPSLITALRSTASQLSREKVRESLVDWVNFIFLPEAVNREVKGRGITSWFQEYVIPHIRDPPPPHITLASVVLLNGRRPIVELSSTATISRLLEAVEKQSGLPIDRQRLVIYDVGCSSLSARLFWACIKLMYVIASACLGIVVDWCRWVLVGSAGKEETILLNLKKTSTEGNEGRDLSAVDSRASCGIVTEDGKELKVAVRHDVTLSELQHRLKLEHGDDVHLEGLVLKGMNGDDGSRSQKSWKKKK